MQQKAQSSKKGKDFEELIEKLEKLLATGDMKVERDVRLTHKITKKKRQIDVLVSIEKPGYKINIMIECRDRSKKDDVRWIEELHTKRSFVDAQVVVAVSKSGFSQDARLLAAHLNIILRTVDEISIAELADWLKVSQIKFVHNLIRFHGFTFTVALKERHTSQLQDTLSSQLTIALSNTSTPYFYHPNSQGLISIMDIWQDTCNRNPDMVADWNSKLSQGIPEYLVKVHEKIDDILEIPGGSGSIVKKIIFYAGITQDVSHISPSRVIKYQESGNALAYLVSFEKKVGDRTFSIDISRANDKVAINVIPNLDATLTIEEDEDTKK